jgi:hypothetical protein
LNIWRNRIKAAEARYKKFEEKPLKEWARYRAGEQWSSSDKQLLQGSYDGGYTEATVDNIVFTIIDSMMATLVDENPFIKVKAGKKPFYTEGGEIYNTFAAAKAMEVLLNDVCFSQIGMNYEHEKCVLDANIGFRGVMQFGFTTSVEKRGKGRLLEVHEHIKGDSVFAIRRSARDVRIDINSTDHLARDAGWVAFRWVKRLEDIKANPRYKDTFLLRENTEVDSSEIIGERSWGFPEGNVKDDFKRVEGWDIWDKRENKLISMVLNYDKFIFEDDFPLQFKMGLPIEVLFFNMNPDKQLPLGDTGVYIAEQIELNHLRSNQLTHVNNISRRKYIERKNAFTEAEKNKLLYGPDGSVLTCAEGSPETALVLLKDAPISQDIWAVINSVKQSALSKAGVTELEQGKSRNFDTATEPELLERGVGARRGRRKGKVREFMVRCVEQIAFLLQQTMDKEISISIDKEQFREARKVSPRSIESIIVPSKEVGRIPGGFESETDGENSKVLLPFMKVNAEDIKGEFGFDIATGATRPFNADMERLEVDSLIEKLAGNENINSRGAAEVLIEAYRRGDLKDRLLKEPEALKRDREAAIRAAVNAETEKVKPKIMADLEKTKMKTGVAREQIEAGKEKVRESNKTSVLLKMMEEEGKGKGNGD